MFFIIPQHLLQKYSLLLAVVPIGNCTRVLRTNNERFLQWKQRENSLKSIEVLFIHQDYRIACENCRRDTDSITT